MDQGLEIRQMRLEDLLSVKDFTDRWIGINYFSISDLNDVYELSFYEGKCCSLLAFDNENLVAVRLTYAPGTWRDAFSKGLTSAQWSVAFKNIAYFKSLFVHENYQNKGLGKELSSQCINILKDMGARAILCHSWLESPNDSSRKYLQKMNFEIINEHVNFWKDIDYFCTRCSPEPCLCTGVEMILYL
jgi:ribosomal protein S18 acetylase RimI-like enzyme